MYATQADVEARLPRPVLPGEEARIAAVLGDVAAALAGRYGTLDLATLVADHYDLLKSAQARAAARIIETPVGPVQNTRLDEASVSYYAGSAELLTPAETADLDTALGRGTGGGLVSVQLTSTYSPPPEEA
jgi:hypothetical protein